MSYQVSTTSGSYVGSHPFQDVTQIPPSTTVGVNFTYEQSFSLAANTSATYYFNAANVNTTNSVITVAALVMKTETIYR